jgi:hypothetical protein
MGEARCWVADWQAGNVGDVMVVASGVDKHIGGSRNSGVGRRRMCVQSGVIATAMKLATAPLPG